MFKKISAIFLALILCLSVMVVPASAIELNGAEIAFGLEWDKEYYKGGDTAVLSVYMIADESLELGAGTLAIAFNSAVISQADNPIADVKASAVTNETFGSYYYTADQKLAWLAATVAPKVTAGNTAEEQALYDHYLKFQAVKNGSGGSHANLGSTKNGFPATDLDPTQPIFTIELKIAEGVADGTKVNAAITSGTISATPLQTTWKYYKNPGVATTTGSVSKWDLSQTVVSATVGEPAVHECTPAEAVKENEVAATCSTAGSYDEVVYCSVCKEEISRKSVTVEATGEHVYSKVIERVEPTCVADGYEIKACGCSDDVTEKTTLPAIGHNYKSVVTKPTCTDKGYTTYTCSVCNDTYTADEVPAKGHSYREKVTAPTCTEPGYTTFTCPFCKDSYTGNETEPAGHKYESVVTAPTCTDNGYTTYTCSVCNDTYTDDEVAALGHNYEQTFVKQPTCTKDGYKRFTCSVCGDSYEDILPATNHTYEDGTSALVVLEGKPATCTETGKTEGKTCSICNSPVVPQVDIPTVDHTWVKGDVVEPTYTEQGYTVYTCSVCGETKNDDFTDVKPGVDVEIETPASTVVNEGETVTLSAPMTNAPAGFTVEWTADNGNFTLEQHEDGSVTLTPVANGNSVITVTVKDENGVVVSTDTIEMTAVVEDAGDDNDDEEPWYIRLIKWIINLFKKLIEIIVDLVKSLVG